MSSSSSAPSRRSANNRTWRASRSARALNGRMAAIRAQLFAASMARAPRILRGKRRSSWGDEPPVLLGSNHGANAVEVVLHALASCLAVGFVYNAAAQGIRVESLDFDIEGDLDLHGFLGLSDEVRPGYQGVKVIYRAKADAPREKVEALCAYVQRTSPVLDILRNPVPVSVTLAD